MARLPIAGAKVQSWMSSCNISDGWSDYGSGFLEGTTVFPANLHSTTAPNPVIMDPWDVTQTWPGSTLSHPTSIYEGLHPWPGTWMITGVGVANIVWNVTPCSPTEVHWRFGGSYCLYLLSLPLDSFSLLA
jgi:hypothetical protein